MSAGRVIATAAVLFTASFAASCGSGERDAPVPAATPEVRSAPAFTMRVALQLPDPLARACEVWAAARNARIDWVMDADGPGEALTLASIGADALDSLIAAGQLRAFAGESIRRSEQQWLADVGRRDGKVFAIPWRARLVALRGSGIGSWADLARLADGGFGIDGAASLDALLALVASTGASGRPDSSSSFDPADGRVVEALAFLAGLVDRAEVAPGTSAVVATSTRHDLPVPWQAFPSPDPDSEGAALARPELLVLPRGGAHLDLGEELALWLCEAEQARLLLANDFTQVPLTRSVEGESEGERSVLALRARAFAGPHRGPHARSWNAVLGASVRAAIERRRSPEDALNEAARWWKEHGQP